MPPDIAPFPDQGPAPPKRTRANSPRLGPLRGLRLGLALASYHAIAYVLSNPGILRVLFGVLRWLRPITIFRNTVIVAKGAYAREVLERFEDFTLGEVLDPRMRWGPFLLTIDWRDQHDRERKFLQSMVVPAADIERIRRVSAQTCQAAIAAAPLDYRGHKELDVVRRVCDPVVIAIAVDYFGIPVVDRDEREMAHLLREVAGIALVDPPEGSRRRQVAQAAIDRLSAHILHTIRETAQATPSAAPAPPDPARSLMSRLVTASRSTGEVPVWLNEDFVRRYVTGLAATGGATIVRATSQAMSVLLSRPKALQQGRAAAARLERALSEQEQLEGGPQAMPAAREAARREVEEARAGLRRIIYEAMRFRPMLPLLLRYTPRDTVLAKGTRHARHIKAGSSVIAGPLAVMFDPEEFRRPRTFDPSRPLEPYVHFGYGPRLCFGKYVADTAMLEIMRALLAQPSLARAHGPAGRLSYDGPVADSLTVTFAPAGTRK